MTPANPHYLLFSEAGQDPCSAHVWRFVLHHVESQDRLSVTESEPLETGSERLELLAVVRGLEALDQPARVTLVTKSRYVSRGIRHGLSEWRANDWRWERFGRLVPVRDHDLWRRVDRALRFHEVDCQAWQFDDVAETQAEPFVRTRRISRRPARVKPRNWLPRWPEVWNSVAGPMRHALGTTG